MTATNVSPKIKSNFKSKIAIGLLWFIQILMAFLFFSSGKGKFTSQAWTTQFERWNYPYQFQILIGLVEVVCAITLLVPRIATYGATTLVIIMIGAIGTKLMNNESSAPVLIQHLIFIAFLATIAFKRSQHTKSGRSTSDPVG